MGNEKEWQKQLDTGLKRVQDALAKDARPHAQILNAVIAAASAHALEKINDRLDREEERQARREERRRAKRERRAHGHGQKDPRAALPMGVVFAGFAALALYYALSQPHLWWMFFVAFGFAMSSAGIVSGALGARAKAQAALPSATGESQQQGASQPEPAAELSPIDQRLARVDAICEKITSAIQGGPAAVREIVHKPEETLKALSGTCKELARRERELRAAITEADERRLKAEREGLSARVAAEPDQVVRARLESALRALDAQLAQRAELATAASRLEAEGTRILYTLENLHTQVLRARSADTASADVAGAGLRRSLEQIGEEMDAVASALEEAHGAGLVSPVQQIGEDPTAIRPPSERERG